MSKPKLKSKEEARKNKPKRMLFLEENIPQKLKDYNQWVVWKWEIRKNNQELYEWQKPLFNVNTGQYASNTNFKS